jgi:hypothetical protein
MEGTIEITGTTIKWKEGMVMVTPFIPFEILFYFSPGSFFLFLRNI